MRVSHYECTVVASSPHDVRKSILKYIKDSVKRKSSSCFSIPTTCTVTHAAIAFLCFIALIAVSLVVLRSSYINRKACKLIYTVSESPQCNSEGRLFTLI
jgi:hypothetical protein